MTWRVIAQRALTREFLSWDVPLNDATTSRALSGPGGVFGTIEPEILRETADDGHPLIEQWSTALYVEEDGQIRGGGIVSKVDYDKPTKTVEAAGFSAYPTGIPYMGEYVPADYPDPVDVFRHIWDYVQSFPDADLGVTVGDVATWMVVSGGGGPFTMFPFETRDCGETLDSLAQAVPFDYLEQHKWNSDKTAILHTIDPGFPRLGRKRTDLRFAESENVTDWSPIAASGERFANTVYLLPEGEGRAAEPVTRAIRDGRLRRAAVIPYKNKTRAMAERLSYTELATRGLDLDISEVTIRDHPNARISAIQPGDDVLVELEVQWLGDVRMWLRVLSVDEAGNQPDMAVLHTQRSDWFTYADPTSPTGDKVPIQL